MGERESDGERRRKESERENEMGITSLVSGSKNLTRRFVPRKERFSFFAQEDFLIMNYSMGSEDRKAT